VIDATVATGRSAQTSSVPDASALVAVEPPVLPEHPEPTRAVSAAAIVAAQTREIVVMSNLRCHRDSTPRRQPSLRFPV
jgi:hypothetical protein